MKKKMMGFIAIVAIVAVTGYNAYTSQNNMKLSSLTLANVEALGASPEIDIRYICAGETKACYDAYYQEVYEGYRWR